MDLVRSRREVIARDRPTVTPQERTNVEHAGAAAIEVRLVVAGKLLHAVAEIEETEMSRADVTAAGSGKQFPASLDHVDAHVVDKRSRHLLRAAHADVVAGIPSRTTRPMRDQQVVPALVKDHHGCFGVDGDIDRLPFRVQPFPRFRIQFDEPDITEVRPVCKPEAPIGGIAKHARVDRVTVGPYDRAAVLPLVVRRRWIERFSDQQADRRLGLGTGRCVVQKVTVA